MALTRPKYSQIYDTDWKQSVELATTTDVGNLVLANVQPNSIDGITVLTNYRILVKDQNSGAQNGIYLVRDAGTGSNGWWSRSLDALTSDRVTAGLSVNVISGSINGGKEFKLTTPDPITLGTTVLTFIDPNAAAGAGGANAQVQFNDASILGGSPGLTFNKYSNVLTLSGNVVTTSGYFVGNGAFLTGIISGGGGTVNYTTSNSTPTSPQTGDFWYNSSIDVLFQYTNDGVGNVWVDIAGPSIQASGVVFDTGLSFTGNISSTNGYFLGSGQFLTGLPIGYSNVNVKAYTETMGFTNYSNVNVIAYTQTIGYTNYSNVNVIAYTQTQSYTNYSNVNLSAYLGGAVTIGGNLTVIGNLFINGNATTINSNNLTVNDSMIYLAEENPADILDIGFTAHVVNPTLNHVGFVRDATDGVWKLFANVAAQPTTTVDFTGATYSNLQIGTLIATAGTVALPAITTTGDTNTGIFFPAADTMAFTEGGVEVMRINSSGNVGIGTTSPLVSLDIGSRTDGLLLPSGTTAQRPASPVNGMTRYNTTTGTWEAYNNSGWIPSNPNIVTNYQSFTSSGTFTPAAGVRNIQLLVVGGGGGGGSGGAGGGGAGGVVYIPNFAVTPSANITVTIGGGGPASTNGVNSSFGNITAYGGGRGAPSTDVSYGSQSGPFSGGSGGGAGATSTLVGSAAPGSSQGSAGGIAPTIAPFPAGGGGGAGQVGQNGLSGVNGSGGAGLYIPMFSAYGASGYFGGGGAGGYPGNSAGSGGLGGGGGTNVAGTDNTGGGGGGAATAKAGGSGVVIVAWYQ